MTSHRRAPMIPDVPPFRGGGPLQARGVPNHAPTAFDARGYPVKAPSVSTKPYGAPPAKGIPAPPKTTSSHYHTRQPGASSSSAAASSASTSRTARASRAEDAAHPEPRPSSRLANEKKKDYKDPPYIGPWKLGKLIGQGASGRVRHAVHSTTGVQAAVKIVPKQVLASSRMSIRDVSAKQDKMTLGIEREIVIMKLIEHPNVLGLMDVYETSKELYLILEYVAGGELFDYLVSKGRLRPQEARAYFRQIIFGLQYCHSFNICHRDLKPENLLLDGSRRVVKVADFGMAALQPGEKMLETSCGSPHYASPEIVSGKSYKGTASDIWSCGIILFALLCGRLPFDDPNIQTLLGKVRVGKFDMPDYLEQGAKDLIWRMLTVDPERRLKMRDITRHPWFTDNGALSDQNPVTTNIDELVEQQLDVANLDMDILSNLKTLWPEYNQEDVISQLTGKGHNWQKVFYSLLVQHRENYSGDDEDDDDAEDADILVAESSKGSAKNSLGLSLGAPKPPSRSASPQPPYVAPLAPRVASPSSARATHLSSIPVPSGAMRPVSPLKTPAPLATTQRDVLRSPAAPQAAVAVPQPSVYVTSGSPVAQRPLPQPRPSLSSSTQAQSSPTRPPQLPTTGFGSAKHAQSTLQPQQMRESGIIDRTYGALTTQAPPASRAAQAPPLNRGLSEQGRTMSPATPEKTRLRSTSMADDSTPKAHPPRPSSRASTTRPRSGSSRNDDRVPSLDALPQEDSASMQQFFRDFADELAAIRVNGERPASLQRKLEQLERMTEQARRNSLHRSQSPRRLAADDPMAQFDDAEDDLAADDGVSMRSATASESSHPYTPNSPPQISPPLMAKPLGLFDMRDTSRRQPSAMTTSTARTTSVQSNATAQTTVSAISTGSSAPPSLGRRRSFLNRIRSQKKPTQESVVAPTPAAEKLQEAYRLQEQQEQQRVEKERARQQQQAQQQQSRLQQRNPGLGLDMNTLPSPNLAAVGMKSPALSAHSGQGSHGSAMTPSTPGSSAMTPGSRSSSSQGAAKQSWFAGLFNWKPAAYTLMSTENFSTTHAEAKRLLTACGARVFVEDSENSAVLKCTLAGDSGMSTMHSKPLKFRVAIQLLPTSSSQHSPLPAGQATRSPTGVAYATSVTLVQEKGPLSAFNRIHNSLRNSWTLDGTGPTSTSYMGSSAIKASHSPASPHIGLGMSLGVPSPNAFGGGRRVQ